MWPKKSAQYHENIGRKSLDFPTAMSHLNDQNITVKMLFMQGRPNSNFKEIFEVRVRKIMYT